MENDPIINQAIQFGIKYGIEAWKTKGMRILKIKRFLYVNRMQKTVSVVVSLEI